MSSKEYNVSEKKCPESVEDIKEGIRKQVEDIIDFCTKDQYSETFFIYEKSLQLQIFQLGCMCARWGSACLVSER